MLWPSWEKNRLAPDGQKLHQMDKSLSLYLIHLVHSASSLTLMSTESIRNSGMRTQCPKLKKYLFRNHTKICDYISIHLPQPKTAKYQCWLNLAICCSSNIWCTTYFMWFPGKFPGKSNLVTTFPINTSSCRLWITNIHVEFLWHITNYDCLYLFTTNASIQNKSVHPKDMHG